MSRTNIHIQNRSGRILTMFSGQSKTWTGDGDGDICVNEDITLPSGAIEYSYPYLNGVEIPTIEPGLVASIGDPGGLLAGYGNKGRIGIKVDNHKNLVFALKFLKHRKHDVKLLRIINVKDADAEDLAIGTLPSDVKEDEAQVEYVSSFLRVVCRARNLAPKEGAGTDAKSITVEILRVDIR